ncbi:hypothetical protein E3Q22_00481 [Wallemia mellicola]|uniref:Uncharacterized protein n=1 Tax=Wallemia mellicola TaxID=1708541 RepID=A0A4T0N2K0_9BASI|nr:hypothetical protein E3Q23_04070 [Wallemia mellicola]TIB73191.1 hypothetical protein E3Q24_01285 [Wallemia mellicola]TIB82117.1 hypothetical protein E3Q22_00481 [Wallemia mellicola]TIB87741.1 hypothetical protein E3Q21_01245 [Wallemia mellicola]TIB90659.1 hypothetical protein E3Q20_01232 [Wallemia mellicola]
MKLAHRIPSILSRLQSTHAIPKIVQLYNGSLSDVYRKLKVFSFGSLGAAVAISPIIAILDAPINTAGRVFLITTALGTINPSNSRQSVELITHSLTLRKLRTVVHDTQWLRRADRPLASWEVSDGELTSTIGEGRDHDVREVIAETFDVKSDKKIGEWFVIWKKSGDSLTAEVQKSGAVDRYFNVDEKSVPSVKVP